MSEFGFRPVREVGDVPAVVSGPVVDPFPRVQGRCPACGTRSLFLDAAGYVTCSWARCARPGHASDVLDTPPPDRSARSPDAGPTAVRHPRRGKAHTPTNPQGFAQQADKTTALTRCGFVLRHVEALPVTQTRSSDRCRICWPEEPQPGDAANVDAGSGVTS